MVRNRTLAEKKDTVFDTGFYSNTDWYFAKMVHLVMEEEDIEECIH